MTPNGARDDGLRELRGELADVQAIVAVLEGDRAAARTERAHMQRILTSVASEVVDLRSAVDRNTEVLDKLERRVDALDLFREDSKVQRIQELHAQKRDLERTIRRKDDEHRKDSRRRVHWWWTLAGGVALAVAEHLVELLFTHGVLHP